MSSRFLSRHRTWPTTRRFDQRGFTLIEMMVVVIIFAIFFAFALPTMRDWIGNRQVSLLAESVAAGLRQAQSEAIQRSTPVDFVLTTSSRATVSANPSTAALTTGGLTSTTPAVSLFVRVVNATTSAGFVQLQEPTEGWRNGRVAARLVGSATPVQGVSFSPLGRVSGTIDATGVRQPPAGAGSVVFQVLNSELPSGLTLRRCVVVSAGGASRICEPSRAAGDPRACLPTVSTDDCPTS